MLPTQPEQLYKKYPLAHHATATCNHFPRLPLFPVGIPCQSIVSCQQLLCLIYVPHHPHWTKTQVNPVKRFHNAEHNAPHTPDCIHTNGQRAQPDIDIFMHLQGAGDGAGGLRYMYICIKYQRHYLCFASTDVVTVGVYLGTVGSIE